MSDPQVRREKPTRTSSSGYWIVLFSIASLAAILAFVVAVYLGSLARQSMLQVKTANTQVSILGTALQNARDLSADYQATVTAQSTQYEREVSKSENVQRSILPLRLTTQSNLLKDKNFDLALLIGLEANRLSNSFETRSNLLSLLGHNPELSAYLFGHSGMVNCLAVNPDGRIIASGGDDGVILLWNLVSNQRLGPALVSLKNPVLVLAFSPNGNILASAYDNGLIVLWDIASNKPLGPPLVGHTGPVSSLSFRSDGQILASSSFDKSIILWDIATHQPIGNPLQGHEGRIFSLAFKPGEDILASGGEDGKIILWDTHTQRKMDTLDAHKDTVFTLAFSPNGEFLASGGNDNKVILWDTALYTPFVLPNPASGPVSIVTFNQDGSVLAINTGNKVLTWDIAGKRFFGKPITNQTGLIRSMVFAQSGHRLVLSGYRSLAVLELAQTPRLVLRSDLQGSPVPSLTYSRDGRLLISGSNENGINMWNANTADKQNTINGSEGMDLLSYSLAFCPSEKALFVGGFKQVYKFDIQTGEAIHLNLEGAPGWLTHLTLSPDCNRLIAISDLEGAIEIVAWDLGTGTISKLPTKNINITPVSIAFSPGNKLFTSGMGNGEILFWDATSLENIKNLHGHKGQVITLAFSRDGKMLASGSADNTIILWDMASQSQLSLPLRGHNSWVRSLAFSPDGQILASGGLDGLVIFWDTSTHQILGNPFDVSAGSVLSLTFSPDGKTLASGTQNGSILYWDMEPNSWFAESCRLVGRNMTQTEWEMFIPELLFHTTCPQYPKKE